MEWQTSDVINAVSAFLLLITIIISLVIGLKSIRHSASIQTRNFQYTQLESIFNWSINIRRCVIEGGLSPAPAEVASLNKEQRQEAMELLNLSNRVNWYNRYKVLEDESESIKAIASLFRNEQLDDAITRTAAMLRAHTEILAKDVQSDRRTTERDKEIGRTKDELYNSAVKLAHLVSNVIATFVEEAM